MIRKIIKSKKGDGYLDVVILVLCSMMMLVLSINVFSFLTMKQDLDYYAKEMLTIATLKGRTQCSAIVERQITLTEETGLAPTIAYETTSFDNTDKVQKGEIIQVTLTIETSFKGFGVLNFPLTLISKYSGDSQVYWK